MKHRPLIVCGWLGLALFLPVPNTRADVSTLDAVFASDSQTNRLCLGDGSGGFTCSNISDDTNVTYGVALGFVDGDAILDAVFATGGIANRVCLGNGSGGFSCSNVSDGSNNTVGVALGFVDGDDNLDAVFADTAPNRVCLGNGSGGFSCSNVSDDANDTSDVALGDLDSLIFSGGFESGDTSGWSNTVE